MKFVIAVEELTVGAYGLGGYDAGNPKAEEQCQRIIIKEARMIARNAFSTVDLRKATFEECVSYADEFGIKLYVAEVEAP